MATDDPFADIPASGAVADPFADIAPAKPDLGPFSDIAAKPDPFSDIPSAANGNGVPSAGDAPFPPDDPNSRLAQLSRRKFLKSESEANPLTPAEDKERLHLLNQMPSGLEGTLLDPANANLGDPALAASVGVTNMNSGISTGKLNPGAIVSRVLSTYVDNLNTAIGSDEEANKDPEIQKLRQEGNAPVIQLPKPTADSVPAGIARGLLTTTESLSTPGNLELLPALAGAPAAVAKVAALGFAAKMAKDVPEQVSEALADPTASGKAQKLTEAIAQSALAILAAKHGLSGERITPAERTASLDAVKDRREAIANAPTDVLQSAAADPEFRKTLPYDPKLIDDELAKRKAEAITEAESPAATPEVSVQESAPQTEPAIDGMSIGPGAASAAEDISNTQRPTSLKRAVVDLQREIDGREEIPVPERAGSAQLVSDAEDAITNNPDIGRQTVDRILDNSASDQQASPKDAAVMLVERTRLRNERAAMQERAVDPNSTQQERDDARYDLSGIEDRIDKLDQASRSAGTAWSDFGRLYQQVMKDDYSLEALERKAIASKAKPGESMTRAEFKEQFPKEHAKLQEQAKRIAELEKDAAAKKEAFTKEAEDAEVQRTHDATVAEVAKEGAQDTNGQKIEPRILAIAEKIVSGLEKQANSALERIRARRAEGRVNSLPVDDLIDYSIYGAAKLARKGLDFTKWSAEMVKDIGDMSADVLKQVWDASNARIDELGKKSGKDAEKVTGALRKKAPKTPVEAKAAAKAEAVAGEPLSHKVAFDYVKSLIQSGVHGVDPLMKAAHEGLKEYFPGLTERDVRRAYSEYGKVKFPSKEAVSRELAETRRITQLQESIDRLSEGKDALHTGLQRDKATQQVREKTKELNELLKKRAGPPSPEKLAGRDEAKQTALKNQIADIDKQLRTGEKPAKGAPIPDSAKTEQLRAERDAMKAKLDEIEAEKNPGKTPEQRYNETRLKQVQKRTAELEAHLQQLKTTGSLPAKPAAATKVKFAALAKAEADLTAKRREINDTIRRIGYDNRSIPAQIKGGALAVLKSITAVKILGHGTVGMFTHAGGLAWRPTVAKIFWGNFGKQFKLWTNKAYHEQAVYKLKNDPDFQTWKNAGASIDPEHTYTDYGLYAKWLGKLGEAGGRGFDALKLTRLELNKAAWDKVSSSIKTDPAAAAETRKAIADINNKATGAIPRVSPVTPEGAPDRITNGVYNLAKNPLADAVFFAPKLYASRWARVVLDPIKTVGTLADWKNSSVADKTAAKIRMKHAGEFAAVYVGALLINKGLLSASGSDQEVNISDPTKPDWLKFKGGGKEVIADGGLLDPIRLLGQVVVGDIINVRTKNQQYREGTRFQKVTQDLAKYARSKFNPTLGLVVDAATGTDYAGKPLPFSNEPPKYKDQGKYTWGEWLSQQGPIPISQGVKVAYEEMRKSGMSHVQIMQILKGAAVAAIGSTGVHVTEDHPKKK